jgi:hypothetical protein
MCKNYTSFAMKSKKKYNDWQIFLPTTCLQAPCRTAPPCSTYSRQHDRLHSRDPEILALTTSDRVLNSTSDPHCDQYGSLMDPDTDLAITLKVNFLYFFFFFDINLFYLR